MYTRSYTHTHHTTHTHTHIYIYIYIHTYRSRTHIHTFTYSDRQVIGLSTTQLEMFPIGSGFCVCKSISLTDYLVPIRFKMVKTWVIGVRVHQHLQCLFSCIPLHLWSTYMIYIFSDPSVYADRLVFAPWRPGSAVTHSGHALGLSLP